MLMSRQGVGGGRAHTHCPWGECRTGSCIAIPGNLTAAVLAVSGIGCQTTFRGPGASAKIDKEVAL
jgi:hypothetical protein